MLNEDVLLIEDLEDGAAHCCSDLRLPLKIGIR